MSDEDHCINCGAILRYLSSDKDWQRAHCRMCLRVNCYRNAERAAKPFTSHEDARITALETLIRRYKRLIKEKEAESA